MSAKDNHRRRSHRSEARKRGAFGSMSRRAWIVENTRSAGLLPGMRRLMNVFRKFGRRKVLQCNTPPVVAENEV